mgnify:CR=1 FL=1
MLPISILQPEETDKIVRLLEKIEGKLTALGGTQETPGAECQLLRDLLSYNRMITDSTDKFVDSLEKVFLKLKNWKDEVSCM